MKRSLTSHKTVIEVADPCKAEKQIVNAMALHPLSKKVQFKLRPVIGGNHVIHNDDLKEYRIKILSELRDKLSRKFNLIKSPYLPEKKSSNELIWLLSKKQNKEK